MSYIKIEIGGKERGLKFNQLAIELISTHNDGKTNSGFMYAMFYGGLMGNSYVKREEPDYTFEDVCDWVDSLKDKEAVTAEVVKAMTETQLWQDLTKVGEADKKKVQKKQPTIT